jgi:hypothetical protein
VLLRVAIDLAGRRDEQLGVHLARHVEHVERPVHRGPDGAHRVALVVDRRGRTGEVVDLVHLDDDRLRHVVAQELEPVIVEEVLDVLAGAGEEVVEADDLVAGAEQLLAEVRAEKSGAAGDEDARHAPLLA